MARHPRAFWIEAVAELDAGASVDEVARRRRVNAGTLRWWRTELRRQARRPPRLLPVIAAPIVTTRAIEVTVGSAVLRIEPGTDVSYVAALVRAIGTAC